MNFSVSVKIKDPNRSLRMILRAHTLSSVTSYFTSEVPLLQNTGKLQASCKLNLIVSVAPIPRFRSQMWYPIRSWQVLRSRWGQSHQKDHWSNDIRNCQRPMENFLASWDVVTVPNLLGNFVCTLGKCWHPQQTNTLGSRNKLESTAEEQHVIYQQQHGWG